MKPFQAFESLVNAELAESGILRKATTIAQTVSVGGNSSSRPMSFFSGLGKDLISGLRTAFDIIETDDFQIVAPEHSDTSHRYTNPNLPDSIVDEDVRFGQVANIRILRNESTSITDSALWPRDSERPYMDFIVTAISEQSSERMQPVKNFGHQHIYFFDGNPAIFAISGLLKKNVDDRWDTKQIAIWNDLMRGTKLALLKCHVAICSQNRVYYGYPYNFALQSNGMNDGVAQFSMQFILSKPIEIYDDLSSLGIQEAIDERLNEWNGNTPEGAKFGSLKLYEVAKDLSAPFPMDLPDSLGKYELSTFTEEMMFNPVGLSFAYGNIKKDTVKDPFSLGFDPAGNPTYIASNVLIPSGNRIQ